MSHGNWRHGHAVDRRVVEPVRAAVRSSVDSIPNTECALLKVNPYHVAGILRMAHLILAVALDHAHKSGLGDLTKDRPLLAAWMRAMSDVSSMQRTA